MKVNCVINYSERDFKESALEILGLLLHARNLLPEKAKTRITKASKVGWRGREAFQRYFGNGLLCVTHLLAFLPSRLVSIAVLPIGDGVLNNWQHSNLNIFRCLESDDD